MRKLTANCWDILKAEESVILLSIKGISAVHHHEGLQRELA